MDKINVNCNKCGTSLKVGKNTEYVTCGVCETQLHIIHEKNAFYTQIIKTKDFIGDTENLSMFDFLQLKIEEKEKHLALVKREIKDFFTKKYWGSSMKNGHFQWFTHLLKFIFIYILVISAGFFIRNYFELENFLQHYFFVTAGVILLIYLVQIKKGQELEEKYKVYEQRKQNLVHEIESLKEQQKNLETQKK